MGSELDLLVSMDTELEDVDFRMTISTRLVSSSQVADTVSSPSAGSLLLLFGKSLSQHVSSPSEGSSITAGATYNVVVVTNLPPLLLLLEFVLSDTVTPAWRRGVGSTEESSEAEM